MCHVQPDSRTRRLVEQQKAGAAVAMWLLIDDQVEQLADPNFPRKPSTRVAGAHELVAHENDVVQALYGPQYYGAFVRDLDGHKIEAKFLG